MKDRERDEKKSPTSVVGVVETDVENNDETFYGKSPRWEMNLGLQYPKAILHHHPCPRISWCYFNENNSNNEMSKRAAVPQNSCQFLAADFIQVISWML